MPPSRPAIARSAAAISAAPAIADQWLAATVPIVARGTP
jgi:hypothetical protein